jgi:DNA-binding response OmpR family regulator
MNERILIIDDDPGFLTLLQAGLEQEGYTIQTAHSGSEGLEKAHRTPPDLIILDIVMPGADGWQICQQLRQAADMPIIVFTGRTGTEDIIKGFAMGADDYVTKPCKLSDLKDRVYKAIHDRTAHSDGDWHITSTDNRLEIDFRTGIVLLAGAELDLTATESRLLLYLASHSGQIVRYEELLAKVWGADYASEMSYLAVYISHLRLKLGDDPAHPAYICTHPGIGYSFCRTGIRSES